MTYTVAFLTGGGHISSFHAAQKALIRKARERSWNLIASVNGYEGFHKDKFVQIPSTFPIDKIPEIGGSFILSKREEIDPELVKDRMHEYGIDALIIMGGDDHLSEGSKLSDAGIPVVGWPKTMDNDLSYTHFTMGYITAADIAATLTEEAHATAYTNQRIVFLPFFGRNADWIVAAAGHYGNSDLILPAEKKGGLEWSILEEMIRESIQKNQDSFGVPFSVIPVSEGISLSGLNGASDFAKRDKFGNIKKDAHDNPIYDPLKLAIALEQAVDESSIGLRASSIPGTYHLRNAKPHERDEKYAALAMDHCVYLIEHGKFGRMASITVGNSRGGYMLTDVPMSQGSIQRLSADEDLIDYNTLQLTTSGTKPDETSMTAYIEPILMRERVPKYKLAFNLKELPKATKVSDHVRARQSA